MNLPPLISQRGDIRGLQVCVRGQLCTLESYTTAYDDQPRPIMCAEADEGEDEELDDEMGRGLPGQRGDGTGCSLRLIEGPTVDQLLTLEAPRQSSWLIFTKSFAVRPSVGAITLPTLRSVWSVRGDRKPSNGLPDS